MFIGGMHGSASAGLPSQMVRTSVTMATTVSRMYRMRAPLGPGNFRDGREWADCVTQQVDFRYTGARIRFRPRGLRIWVPRWESPQVGYLAALITRTLVDNRWFGSRRSALVPGRVLVSRR